MDTYILDLTHTNYTNYCWNAAPALGTARLVGGASDPGGAWAYGRLEVSDGLAFSSVRDTEPPFRSAGGLGRNAAAVACRSLGFADGVQMTAGRASALPGPAGDVQSITLVACSGSEANLGECRIDAPSDVRYDDYEDVEVNAAVMCSTPTGTPPPFVGTHARKNGCARVCVRQRRVVSGLHRRAGSYASCRRAQCACISCVGHMTPPMQHATTLLCIPAAMHM